MSGLLKTVRGLTGGVPARGFTVELKNGWLPRTSGWVITSLAHVHGAGRDYVMAVYTKNGPSMQSGITTVQGLSALAWKAARSSAAAGRRRAAAAGLTGRPSRFFAVCCRRVLSSSPVACSGPGAVPRPATGVRTYCECGVAAAARDQRLKRATARILFIASSAATL